MVCSLGLLTLLQCVVPHTVIALEKRHLKIEENYLHKQLFHYETLRKSDIFVHDRHHRDVDSGHVTARTYVRFFTLGMNFSMILKAGSPVLAPEHRAYTVDRNGKYEPLHVDSKDFLTGHLQENESIKAYAHYEEDILCTTVYFPNEIYFTEPSWRYLPSSSGWDLISYRLSDVNWSHMGHFPNPLTLLKRPFLNGSVSIDKQHQRFSKIRHKRQNDVFRKKCSLRLVADYSFYREYARSSASRATQIMVSSIQEANRVYQDTRWNLEDSLGWGFVIKQILVHTEYSNGPSNGPFSYNYEVDHWNTSDKLEAFSRHRNIMMFCLSHLFTNTLFMNSRGTIGLAYAANMFQAGGICSQEIENKYPRTGWTTSVYGAGWSILGIQHQLITVHELGHNWGSLHDPEGPCSPSDEEGGHYIMYPSSSPGNQPNNMRFSQCSVDSISRILRYVSQECFVESSADEIPCGNGVVDRLEECDAGADGLEGRDQCCSSICLLRQNAQCSDFNSQCCRNCSVAPAGTECKPDNECLEGDTCDGVNLLCSAGVPVANGAACQTNRVCYEGRCLSSCEMLEAESERVYRPCMCENNATDACKQCCSENFLDRNGPCLPTETSLGIGARCYNGVCNEQGECVAGEVSCGNGVIDEREECDVGERGVRNEDKCCNSICHLKESAQCSDINQACCRDCRIAPNGTVCEGEGDFDPTCMEIAECDGVSSDCPSTLPRENGTVCDGDGVCYEGWCLSSCELLGEEDGGFYEPCMCDNNAIDACKQCCMKLDSGRSTPCLPTEKSLGFGARCYNGVCNERGECVKNVSCGDGVLDEGEECDVGDRGVNNQDECCNSTCHLKESAQCSDINKACCRDCRIAPNGTVCEDNFDLPCMEIAGCDGVSSDCPSALPKENGMVCHGEGQCINGRCMTKYCKELGREEDRIYRACMCEQDASAACKRCCMEIFDNGTNGPCFPTNEALRYGQFCYNGECNEKGLCIPSEGNFIARLINFFDNLDFNTLGTSLSDFLLQG